MSFAESEELLRQYFIETGLQGWGETTHPPNELQLLFNVRNIRIALDNIEEKVDNDHVMRWKVNIQQLRQSQQPIEEWLISNGC